MADNIVGQIALELGVNTENFKRQLRNLGNTTKSSVGGITANLKKIAPAVAAAFSVAAVVSFAKACTKLGSDLAEVQNVVDVTFGEMSSSVNQWAKDAMTSYGLSEKVAKEYVGQLGAMSKAFGNSTAEAYEQATALTGLAGDVASFYNLTTDEAFTKLKAVYTGETEALKSLGVVMTQTALDEFALQKGFGKTTDKMSEQEKVALRLAFVQERLAGASGDFVRTSDGWANQTRVLSLRFDALKASIGQGLIAALLPAVRVLNELVSQLQVAAEAFSDFMQSIFGATGGSSGSASLGESLAIGSDALSSNMGSAENSAKAIKKSLAGFDQINMLSSGSSGDSSGSGVGGGSSFGASGSVGAGVSSGASAAEKMKTLLGEIKTKLIEIANITGLSGLWANFLAGVENVKLGVEGLFTAFSNAMAINAPNFEAFKNSVINAFLTMSNTVSTVMGDMWLILSEGFRSFVEEKGPAIEQFFAGFTESLTKYYTLIADVVGELWGSISAWWDQDGARIWTEFVDCLKDIGDWILRLWNEHLKPVVDWIIVEARSLWTEYLKPLWDKLLSLITSLWDAFKALWDNVLKPLVDWLMDTFGPPLREAAMAFVTIIKNAVGTISTVIGGIVDTLKAVLDFVVGGFTTGWNNAWEKLKKKFGEIWEGMKTAISKPLNGMLSGIESFINSIIKGLNALIRAMNKISFDVPSWVPGIGGQTWGCNIPEVSSVSLPRLATGGYVAANTPQLAIVGDNKREGEIIAPESKIAEAVASGFAKVMSKLTQSGNKQPIYLTIKLGESEFWQGFVDYHNSVVKSTGETPLLI